MLNQSMAQGFEKISYHILFKLPPAHQFEEVTDMDKIIKSPKIIRPIHERYILLGIKDTDFDTP